MNGSFSIIDFSLELTWVVPWDAVALRLIRRTRAFPRNPQDGEALLDQIAPLLSVGYNDEEPLNGYINYYAVFFQRPDGTWTDPETFKTEAYTWYGFVDIMYDRLPEIYRNYDKGIGEDDSLLGWGDDKYGADEYVYGSPITGSSNKPLYRYLRIPGHIMEQFRLLYESMEHHKDPMEIDSEFLEFLAWDVGWIINRELSTLRQRMEIKNAVRIYKRKATAAGLEALISALINWPVEIITPGYNILFRNRYKDTDPRYDSTRLDTVDPDVKLNMGTSRDTIDYRMGPTHRPDTVRIILTADSDFSQFNRVYAKLIRIISEWIPICTQVIFTLRTQNDDGGLVGESRPATDADLLTSDWLLRNSTPTLPNPNDNELYHTKVRSDTLWRRPLS